MKSYTLIKNPLTVIAIFASLTEIVCGAVTPFVSDTDNQKLFLIFVIGFPILLVILFFITLNLNHKVLYSPSDFNETDNNIAELFYGKVSNAIIDSSNKELKKNTSEFFVNIDDLDESRKPYYKYAQDFLTLVEKLLPTEKIEEINFDSENDIVYTLEIRIKTAYTKANEKNREVFVLIISHDSIYNTEEEGKVKKTYGGIAGAGMPEQQNTPEKLAIFVLKTITDRLN